MSYEVREITDLPRYLPELEALHRACHEEIPTTKGTPFRFRYDLLERQFYGGHYYIFGAFHEGKLIGHASGYVSRSMRTDELVASDDVVYVVPEHRKGLGTRLGEYTIAQARKIGVNRYRVSVMNDNPSSARVAQRLGFEPVGTLYEMKLHGLT